MPAYDAILIPGGGVRTGGELPPWSIARLQRALEMENGELFITLSAGSVHVPPPLDEDGFPILESLAAARYLLSHGIPSERILTETCSLDTIGNAFFARLLHVEPLHLRRLAVITSEFHMPRTAFIFRWVFSLDVPPEGYELHFETTPNCGMDSETLAARQKKEAQSLKLARAVSQTIDSMTALHRWLFNEHHAYAVGKLPLRIQGKSKDTY
jgi:hypothetical protein